MKIIKFRNSNNDKDIFILSDLIIKFESKDSNETIIFINSPEEETYILPVSPEALINRIYKENPNDFEIIEINTEMSAA
ncbi:hypothetical protein [Ferruginibacter sp.]|nr:hypothetical protein [Ferruginibacter sp.]